MLDTRSFRGRRCREPAETVVLMSEVRSSSLSTRRSSTARRRSPARLGTLIAVSVALVGAMIVGSLPGAAAAPKARDGQVRGFDADLGTKARFERANADNEVKGVTFEYLEFADDKFDPAISINEARRLVDQKQVFAIVPTLSVSVPVDYLTQKKVPFFGWGFDPNAFCTETPSKKIWGFGFSGCTSPVGDLVNDTYGPLYDYISNLTGKKKPTAVVTSNDNAGGQSAVTNASAQLEGAGFEVVSSEANVPEQVSDYAPYTQDWLTAADGEEPDLFFALFSVQSLQIVNALNANGYDGTIVTGLYSDLLVKPLEGTLTTASYNVEPNDGLAQMQADLEAVKPGTPVTSTNAAAYLAADMFIQAVKKAAKNGKQNITPDAVQKAASKQTWQIEGFAGPTKYPKSSQVGTEACGTLLQSDGTAWNIVNPYTCSSKTFKKK
jgi:branched-chain amino acid transport system substrate-binding protein